MDREVAVRGIDWVSVKAVPGKDWHLRVLGVPFNGPYNGKDAMGEYFSPQTDIMMAVGDWRPVIYYHGMKPSGSETAVPEVIGRAQLIGKTARGFEFDVWLDQTKALAKRVWDAALKGLAKASSGAVAHLVRTLKKTGEILTWPLGELSLLDVGDGREPANPWATVTPMRAVFDQAEIELPESLAEGDEPKADEAQPVEPVEQAAVVAEPVEPIKPDETPEAVVVATVVALKGIGD